MALQTRIPYATASAACDAIVDRLDIGGAGTVKVYDGTQPANADTAVSTQNILCEFTLANPAFGAASNGAASMAGGTKTDSSANNTGTATWFRAFNGAGTVIIDGSVAATGGTADMIIDNTSIASGQTVNLTAWTVTMPRQ